MFYRWQALATHKKNNFMPKRHLQFTLKKFCYNLGMAKETR